MLLCSSFYSYNAYAISLMSLTWKVGNCVGSEHLLAFLQWKQAPLVQQVLLSGASLLKSFDLMTAQVCIDLLKDGCVAAHIEQKPSAVAVLHSMACQACLDDLDHKVFRAATCQYPQ